MKIHQKEKGFTIIEVVLVLAIAGLIFLMVFIALPALQRSQRDTARKSDAGIVSSAVASYTGNNRGAFPTNATIISYTKNKSDNTSSVTVSTSTGAQTVSPADGVITVTQGTTCSTSSTTNQILTGGTTRQYTVVTKLEEGGGAYYCQEN